MTWQGFVLEHGRSARAVWLARVLEQPVDAIREVRGSGACRRLPKRLGFAELFTRWHGRPPADEDWPAPQKIGGGYEWLVPELALLARLVGTTAIADICRILTERLQRLTGDPSAARDGHALERGKMLTGLQSGTDLVGGLTTREAGKRVGSLALINQAIHNRALHTFRVGHRHVIPVDEFERWFALREQPPEGWVRLASLRTGLGISSDSKLPEYAALGYIPDVRLVRGIGTARGVWYIAPARAQQILDDAGAGRPMPWHGKPLPINQRQMWTKWQARKHRWCRRCTRIWNGQVPGTFEAFCARYASLSLGDKRHLTVDLARPRATLGGRPHGTCWDHRAAGLTVYEAAQELSMRSRWIRTLIREGLFERGGLKRDAAGGEAFRITPLGMCMLRVAAAEERAKSYREQIALGVHAAAQHAGVSIGTIHKWGDQGLVMTRPGPRGLLFERSSLEAQTRRYWAWARVHFKRASPPAWLQQEPAA